MLMKLRQILVTLNIRYDLFGHISTLWMTFIPAIFSVLEKMKHLKRVVFGVTPERAEDRKIHGTFEAVKDGQIQIHPFTTEATRAWQMLSVKQTVRKLNQMPRKSPINPKMVRFVCISDTHNKTDNMSSEIPDGDVLLHAGDFTNVGHFNEVEHFNTFLGKLPHKHKIVIAGNHELSFDPDFMKEDAQIRRFGLRPDDLKEYLTSKNLDKISDVLTNCTYLEDSETSVYGIKIYGSPWQPEFGGWGYNLPRGQACLEKWNKIPENVDILLTHGPPIGHGDLCYDEQRAGCVELLHTIQHRVKPKYHVFGHVHEGYGVTTDDNVKYVNASTCTMGYKPDHNPIVFDLPLPPGYTKDEALVSLDNTL